jgi:glutamyl/glutaminyl-tRNA synthetase
MRNDKTKKLGKRDGAKDILEYKKDGFLPETMVNFLSLVGWNPGTEQEVFKFDDLVNAFNLSQIHKAGGVFNEEKLRWMNKEHLKMLPRETVAKGIKERLDASERVRDLGWDVSMETVRKITPAVLERMEVYSDVDMMVTDRELDYYFTEPAYNALSLRWKGETDLVGTVKHLTFILSALTSLPAENWTEDNVKGVIWPYAETEGRGPVLWPLRFALSGKDKSPNPFTLADILGKETTIKRIEEALKKCANGTAI